MPAQCPLLRKFKLSIRTVDELLHVNARFNLPVFLEHSRLTFCYWTYEINRFACSAP